MVWIRRRGAPSENHGKMVTKDFGIRVILITSMLYFVTSNIWSRCIISCGLPAFFVYSGTKGNNFFVFLHQGGQPFMYTLGHINMDNFVISNQCSNLILVVSDSIWILFNVESILISFWSYMTQHESYSMWSQSESHFGCIWLNVNLIQCGVNLNLILVVYDSMWILFNVE